MRVAVIGAGVAGLVSALELAERGAEVTVFERAETLGAGACSWLAGGMLAPWCERVGSEAPVQHLGRQALAWWPRHFDGTVQRGTLVVAPARDAGELARFARRSSGHVAVDGDCLAELEPDLAGRFDAALLFPEEAHLDPRQALTALIVGLAAHGVVVRFGIATDEATLEADAVLDCRGFAARHVLPGLRGVRGEMALVRSRDITLSRPVRLLHPRTPVYVVPRGEGLFMIGATMVESSHDGPATVRSAMELLGAAYALHPAFAEAEIVELGAGVRPAFPDNLPRLVADGRMLRLNGLFRHGFLLSPAYARQAADLLLSRSESSHDPDRQRRSA